MKPFNLEQAKAGKPVCTRDGRPVRIICFDKRWDKFPIVALVGHNEEDIKQYGKDGKIADFSDKGNTETADDLIMVVREKHEGWINLYRGVAYLIADYTIYKTQEDALAAKLDSPAYKATAKIEWEE